jgi:hypothetical protein
VTAPFACAKPPHVTSRLQQLRLDLSAKASEMAQQIIGGNTILHEKKFCRGPDVNRLSSYQTVSMKTRGVSDRLSVSGRNHFPGARNHSLKLIQL